MEDQNNIPQQDNQQFTPVQQPATASLSNEKFEAGDGDFERRSKRRVFLLAVAAILVIIAGAIFYFNLNAKKEFKQKVSVPQSEVEDIKQQSQETVGKPSSVATEGAVIPTISDDTSLETVEKEIQSLEAEGLDQGDASIESDLQNL